MTPIAKFAKLLLALFAAGAVLAGMSGCKRDSAPATATQPATAPAAAGVAADGSRLVEIKVTERGYEPSPLTLKQGEPVTLQATRTTDRTCATEFILDEHGINAKLPLNETVTIKFTPKESGELVYGCHMDKMISGRFVVQ